MERPPEPRAGEQYPLLKEGSGLTSGAKGVQPVAQTPSWTVTCAPKQSWLSKYWPEFISASWMTLILLGSSFLVFYALGMGVRAYRRPQLLIKYHEAKPSSNVLFHHIVQRECNLPFALYSPYLSSMAVTYPNLRLKVIFLVNDIRSTYYVPRHTKLYSGLLSYKNNYFKDESVKQELKEFEKRHPNVNITIVALNKYMAMTPLRFKWRTIPLSYLSFYTRIFSVWQNGGIGMDLTTYDNHFCNSLRFDRRVTEILKNHNEGVPIKDYNVLLQDIDEEEENCFKTLKQILNDTLSMFNSVFSFGMPLKITESLLPSDETPAVRTQRVKRNAINNFYELETTEGKFSTDTNNLTEIKNIETLDNKVENLKENNSLETEVPQTATEKSNFTFSSSEATKTEPRLDNKLNLTVGHNSNNVSKENPGIFIYDFSFVSNDIGQFLFHEPQMPPFISQSVGFNSKSETVRDINKKKNKDTAAQIALSMDGSFVAAIDKMHPFLGMLITAGLQKQRPEFAIQDTIITQCSGTYKDESYCNIYGL